MCFGDDSYPALENQNILIFYTAYASPSMWMCRLLDNNCTASRRNENKQYSAFYASSAKHRFKLQNKKQPIISHDLSKLACLAWHTSLSGMLFPWPFSQSYFIDYKMENIRMCINTTRLISNAVHCTFQASCETSDGSFIRGASISGPLPTDSVLRTVIIHIV